MTVVASIALSEDAFVLGAVFADTAARIELLELVPIEGTFVPYFWLTGEHDVEAFEADVRDSDAIAEITRLDTDGERTLYRIDWSGSVDGFFGALADNDVLVDEGIRTAEKWTFQLRSPDRDALSGFRDDCAAHGIGFDLRSIHYDPAADDPAYDLTEKQAEALELAFEEGYFEVPRATTIVDLAAKTDVTQQAFSRRLQRAQREVFARLFPLGE